MNLEQHLNPDEKMVEIAMKRRFLEKQLDRLTTMDRDFLFAESKRLELEIAAKDRDISFYDNADGGDEELTEIKGESIEDNEWDVLEKIEKLQNEKIKLEQEKYVIDRAISESDQSKIDELLEELFKLNKQ